MAGKWPDAQLSSTMNTSSVHLRDLNDLVSAFSGNSNSDSHRTKDPSDNTRLHVEDGVSSYEEDRQESRTTTFPSKIYFPTNPPVKSQSIFDKIQHRISAKNNLFASEKEPNGVQFGEQCHFNNGTELISLDSSSTIETNIPEIQNGKTSLHLISELCDRLAASDSAEKSRHDKATQAVMEGTPNGLAPQTLNLNNQTCFFHATPNSQTNVPAMKISTALQQSPDESCSCTLSDSHILIPGNNNDTIENSYNDFLAQYHGPCVTCCEPADAVSCLEQMMETITPVDETYKPCEMKINQLLPDIQSSEGLTNSNSGR